MVKVFAENFGRHAAALGQRLVHCGKFLHPLLSCASAFDEREANDHVPQLADILATCNETQLTQFGAELLDSVFECSLFDLFGRLTIEPIAQAGERFSEALMEIQKLIQLMDFIKGGRATLGVAIKARLLHVLQQLRFSVGQGTDLLLKLFEFFQQVVGSPDE